MSKLLVAFQISWYYLDNHSWLFWWYSSTIYCTALCGLDLRKSLLYLFEWLIVLRLKALECLFFLNRYDVTYCKNSSFSMEVNSTYWVLHLSVVIPWNCPGLLVCLLAFFLPLFYFLLKLFLLFHTAFPCSVQPCLEEASRNSFMESTPGCRVPSAIQHVSRRLPGAAFLSLRYKKSTWDSMLAS